jgi:hypothetical protein
VNRHEFLTALHDRLAPRSYLEIGVNDGRSLTLSRAPSIAVDPAFKVTSEVYCDLHLVRATSDDFFARPDPVAHLPGGIIDLGFIDGMHLSDFALRDFINVERFTTWTSVIVLDDMLPRSVSEAARDRHTGAWAGDVYKVLGLLRARRPDLVCLPVDTEPTGMVVVFGADAGNTTLSDGYDELLAEIDVPDPQDVPADVLTRTGSVDPARLLDAPAWRDLLAAREAGRDRDPDIYRPLGALVGTGPVRPPVAPPETPWPPRRDKPAARSTPARPPKQRETTPKQREASARSGLRRRVRRGLRRLAARL